MRAWLAHYHKRYQMISYRDRTMLMSIGTFSVNALIGAGKLFIGIAIFSPWFMITAVYYLLLCGARGQLLWRFKQTRDMEDPKRRFDLQFSVFRHSGVFVCLIGVSYLFVCLRMYFWGEGSSYPFYLVYGVAGIAFYKIGTSVYGIVVSKRMKNPLLTTMKVIAFIDSCVSIVAVQCALLTMEEGSAAMASQSSALFGAGCGIVFIGIGMFMLLRKKVYPKPDEFDIKDKVQKPRTLNKAKETELLTSWVTEWIWEDLQKNDASGHVVCSVSYKKGSFHIFGFGDRDFDYERCVKAAILAFDSGLKEIPVVCSIQKRLSADIVSPS